MPPPTSRSPWSLEDLLSRDRMTPYLATCAGDFGAALELYDWNSQASSAFHESLHYAEVGLRNALDHQLERWSTGCGATAPWYVDRVVPLTPPTRKKIEEARRNATRGGVVETHGKVVAELTLGFWWSLLAGEYNLKLWAPCLQFAFDGPVRRTRLHRELNELRLLRNRIAHHEPIHHRALTEDYRRLLDTSRRISPLLMDRIAATSRVPSVLDGRPGRKVVHSTQDQP